MDRLEYNILLEEVGIYDRKEITKDQLEDCNSEFVYKTAKDKKLYTIIPNDLSPEEIRTALLVKQIKLLHSLEKSIGSLSVIVLLSFIIISLLLLYKQ